MAVRVAQRAKMLLAAEDQQDKAVARQLGAAASTVARWRSRFLAKGIAGIEKAAPRPGRKPAIPVKTVLEIIRKTTQETPSKATQWSTRTMAQAPGVSEASVRCIWRKHGLNPHRVKSFKLSNDPHFAKKLDDILGVYLNPPEHSLVLCVGWVEDSNGATGMDDLLQHGEREKRGAGTDNRPPTRRAVG
jgi:transposase